jgi:hypothetical protein
LVNETLSSTNGCSSIEGFSIEIWVKGRPYPAENEKGRDSLAFLFFATSAGWRMLAGGRWLLQRAGEGWLASRTR